MTEELTVITERVDDIPVLLAHMIKLGLPQLLDEHFPVHGNWQGLSLGWTTTVWLSHILSEGDHRLNQVEPWAEQRLDSLRRCTGQALERARRFSANPTLASTWPLLKRRHCAFFFVFH